MFYSSITDILLVIEPVYDHLCFIASEIKLILATAELDYGDYSVLFMLTIHLFVCMYTEFSHWDTVILSQKVQNDMLLRKKKKDRAFPSNTTCGKFKQGLTPDQVSPQSFKSCKPHLCFCITNL